MKKYLIVFVLLLLIIINGLISCKETNTEKGSLVGLWVSTKVDTLTRYIQPVKPDAFVSRELKNCTLSVHADGSLKMIKSGDTISGTWNPGKPDTIELALKHNIIRLKIGFTDNNLVISNETGWITAYQVTGGGNYQENGIIITSKHFIRK
ncbi:MAG TPA: hypothetical protein VFG54_13785 [Prolixibacteraceae bacterium]|nr:hypothetical protein [Prolixibacteraceae bacterium]